MTYMAFQGGLTRPLYYNQVKIVSHFLKTEAGNGCQTIAELICKKILR
jgi:hypothetical protein